MLFIDVAYNIWAAAWFELKICIFSMRSGQIRNCESARVSMPGQLKSISTGEEGVTFIGNKDDSVEPLTGSSVSDSTIIEEGDESEEQEHTFQPPLPKEVFIFSLT